MSPGAWLFSVALAVTLGVALYNLANHDITAAVWWALGCWIVIGSGAAYFYLESRTTRLTNDRQSRPHIDVVGPILLEELAIGQTPVVGVTLKNTGRTPAVDVMAGSRVQVGDFPLFTDTKYVAVDGPRVTLGAGQSATVHIPADHPLTEDELAGLTSGMKWLKAHGEIVFTTDPPPQTPFKHPHFCFVLKQLGNVFEVCDNLGNHTDQGVFR